MLKRVRPGRASPVKSSPSSQRRPRPHAPSSMFRSHRISSETAPGRLASLGGRAAARKQLGPIKPCYDFPSPGTRL
eukprot:3821959-Pyramimonas_sp.AAC.1